MYYIIRISMKLIIREIKKENAWRTSWVKSISRAITDTCKDVSNEDAEKSANLFLQRLVDYR